MHTIEILTGLGRLKKQISQSKTSAAGFPEEDPELDVFLPIQYFPVDGVFDAVAIIFFSFRFGEITLASSNIFSASSLLSKK